MKKYILFLFLLLTALFTHAQIVEFYPMINSIGYRIPIPLFKDTLQTSCTMSYGKSLSALQAGFLPSKINNFGKHEFRGSFFNLEANTKYVFHLKILWGDGSLDLVTDSIYTKPEPVIIPTSNIKYVNPAGLGNLYTQASPGNLKTLLAGGLSCGTTVILKGGTYRIGDMQLNLLQDCGVNSPIVIMAAPNEIPILDGGDYTQYTWTKSGSDSNLYYTTIKPGLEYNSLCLMDSTRLYPYGCLTPSSIDPSYPCLANLNFGLSGFYRNANVTYIKTLDHKNPNNSNIIFSGYFYCLQVQGNRKNNYVYIRGITFKNYGKGSCTKDIFGNPTCYPSFTVDFENASNVIIDSCKFEYCNIPLTFGHRSNNNIIQHCTFIDGIGEWSHGAFKQSRDENILERGTYGRYLEYSAIHLFPDDTIQKGNIVRNNFVKGSIGGLVGERVTGYEGIAETDIYNNRVTYCYNGINADGGSVNTRIWNNEIDHCSVGLSFISAACGPNYIFRNNIHHIIERKNYHYDVFFMDCNNVQSSKIWGTGVKLNAAPVTSNPPEMFFVNNTFHSIDSIGFCMYLWNSTWKKLYSRNNIFYSEGLSSLFFDGPKDDTAYSFNSAYDCYYNKTHSMAATVQPTNGIAVCNNYNTGAALGPGLKATSQGKDVSVNNDVNINPGFKILNVDFHLKYSSPLVDKGILINGFNDNYKGSAPDIGAYENDTAGAIGISGRREVSTGKLRVFPNPGNSSFRITNYDGARTNTFEIINLLGQKIMEGGVGEKETVVNISSLSSGVYFIRLGNEVVKFVRE